jgi:hypothetical protein
MDGDVMKVKIGEKIGCDFGEGFLIAATKTWAIIDIDDEEYAVPKDETWVYAEPEIGGGVGEVEIK